MRRTRISQIQIGGSRANDVGRVFFTLYNEATGQVRMKIFTPRPASVRRVLSLPYGPTPVVARQDKRSGAIVITYREE